jgi:hypothetical protein
MRGEDHTLQFSAEFAQHPPAREGERILGVPQRLSRAINFGGAPRGWSPSKQIARGSNKHQTNNDQQTNNASDAEGCLVEWRASPGMMRKCWAGSNSNHRGHHMVEAIQPYHKVLRAIDALMRCYARQEAKEQIRETNE